MRSEIKIPINNNFELYFDNWVNFKSKIQKQYDDRLITSIYYDSENFTTARDNLAGISNRCKYRIRWYNDKSENFNYEIKIKKNNLGKKLFLKSDRSLLDFNLLFSNKNDLFKKKENEFFLNYLNSNNLVPKMNISYLRSYFVFQKKIRITYDRKISYKLINKHSLKKNIMKDFMNVIEIKFEPENTSLALNLIQNSNFNPKRFSKYLRGLHLFGISNYL